MAHVKSSTSGSGDAVIMRSNWLKSAGAILCGVLSFQLGVSLNHAVAGSRFYIKPIRIFVESQDGLPLPNVLVDAQLRTRRLGVKTPKSKLGRKLSFSKDRTLEVQRVLTNNLGWTVVRGGQHQTQWPDFGDPELSVEFKGIYGIKCAKTLPISHLSCVTSDTKAKQFENNGYRFSGIKALKKAPMEMRCTIPATQLQLRQMLKSLSKNC